MSSPRVRPTSSSSMSLLVRAVLAAVACIAGFAPFTHLVAASVAPIVHEDGGSKGSTAAPVATTRRRGRVVPRRRLRPLAPRGARASDRSVVPGAPAPVAPLLTILRL